MEESQQPVETTGEEGAVEVVAPKPYVLTDLFNYRG
jgi:hypothetical protein